MELSYTFVNKMAVGGGGKGGSAEAGERGQAGVHCVRREKRLFRLHLCKNNDFRFRSYYKQFRDWI